MSISIVKVKSVLMPASTTPPALAAGIIVDITVGIGKGQNLGTVIQKFFGNGLQKLFFVWINIEAI